MSSLNTLTLPCLPGIGLMLSAITHRMLLGHPSYERSLLIPVEFFLATVVLLGLVGMTVTSIWFLVRGQMHDAKHYSCCSFANFVLLTGALVIDAPTLIYMT